MLNSGAMEDSDTGSLPDRAEVAIAHIVKQAGTAFYVLKIGTSDGKEWAVSRRYSAFASLRSNLLKSTNNRSALGAVPFPPKKFLGGADRDVVKSRKAGLTAWIRAILPLCKTERTLAWFLAEDQSVAPVLLQKIGLGPARLESPAGDSCNERIVSQAASTSTHECSDGNSHAVVATNPSKKSQQNPELNASISVPSIDSGQQQTMKLTVQDLFGQHTIVSVRTDATVGELKDSLQANGGPPVDAQRLLFNSACLEVESENLSAHMIQDGAIISLTLQDQTQGEARRKARQETERSESMKRQLATALQQELLGEYRKQSAFGHPSAEVEERFLRQKLFQATGEGITLAVSALLDRSADPDSTNEYKQTALHIASRSGWSSGVCLLVRRGACIDARDATGVTPLMCAAEYGHADTCSQLLELGADATLRDFQVGYTALVIARRFQTKDCIHVLEAANTK